LACCLGAILLTIPVPSFAHEKSDIGCGILALVHNSKKEANFSDASSGCPFDLNYEINEQGILTILGPHWVVQVQIPEDGKKHWLAYQWGSLYAVIEGKEIPVQHYFRHEL
jgi:hypothetical protein